MATYTELVHSLAQQATTLDHSVSLFVPSTSNVNQYADNAEQVRQTSARLSRLFGGATVTKGSGCWLSDVAGLVSEDVSIVTSYCGESQLAEHLIDVVAEATYIKRSMGQEAVSLVIDGTLYLI